MIRLPDRPKPGDPLAASWAGDVVDNLARLGLRFGRTIRAIRGPRGSATLDVDIPDLIYAKAPSGGIAARTSVDVYPYTSIIAATLATTTIRIHNVGGDTVPSGGKLLFVDPATYHLLFWTCANAPTTAMSL